MMQYYEKKDDSKDNNKTPLIYIKKLFFKEV